MYSTNAVVVVKLLFVRGEGWGVRVRSIEYKLYTVGAHATERERSACKKRDTPEG